MPAGRGPGCAGALGAHGTYGGAGHGPGGGRSSEDRTTLGSHRELGACPVFFAAVAVLEGAVGALAHGQEGRLWPAGRPGPRSLSRSLARSPWPSPPPPPSPSRLLLAAAAPRPAPRGRSAGVRSCASRGDEECGPRLGRPALFPPFPPSLCPGRHPWRLSIPNARSKSERGAGLGEAGPRLPLGAAGEGVGTAGELQRGRGWPGAGADVGRVWRPCSFWLLAASGPGMAVVSSSPPWSTPPTPPPGARTWPDSKNQYERAQFDHFGLKNVLNKIKELRLPLLTFSLRGGRRSIPSGWGLNFQSNQMGRPRL
jgi:hypothetical protein